MLYDRFMSSSDATSRLFRELTERIARELDPEKLEEMISEINHLLDVVEAQLTRLEGPSNN